MQGSPEREKGRTDAFFLLAEIKKPLCRSDFAMVVNEKVQILPGIQDTRTIITFKAFGTG
jgi:hypothetical protein